MSETTYDIEAKILHILGNFKGGVITADEALKRIKAVYEEKAIKEFEMAVKDLSIKF